MNNQNCFLALIKSPSRSDAFAGIFSVKENEEILE